MKPSKRIVLRQREAEPGVAYLELQAHPHSPSPAIVANSVFLHWLVEDYNGPGLIMQFNKKGEAIGIEILYPSGEEEEEDSEPDRTTKRVEKPRTMKPRKEIRLKKSRSGNVAYLQLHAHPHSREPGIVAHSVFLHHLIEDYNGPALIMEFNKDGEAIGIQILYTSGDEEGND